MKRKDFGLIASVALLAYMAGMSEKLILVADGYAVPREEIVLGAEIYHSYCHGCHGKGQKGAPRIGDAERWEKRLRKGIEPLIAHAIDDHRRARYLPPSDDPELVNDKIAAAVAYLVRESQK